MNTVNNQDKILIDENRQSYAPYDPSENIPSIDIKKQAMERTVPIYDETKIKEKGYYQQLRQAERMDLIETLARSDKLTNEQARLIGMGIPNAKFAWFNVVLKRVLNGNKINRCDYTLIEKSWMNEAAKQAILAFIKDSVDNVSAITARFPTKSKMAYDCVDGQLKVNMKNPGVYNLYTGQTEHYPDFPSLYREVRNYNQYDANVDYTSGRTNCSCGDKPPEPVQLKESTIHKRYKKFINELMDEERNNDDLMTELGAGSLSRHLYTLGLEIKDGNVSADALYQFYLYLRSRYEVNQVSYLQGLFNPFTRQNTKIPTMSLIPSSSFTITDRLNLTSNASGNVSFAWSPFYLNVGNLNLIAVNNNVGLTGGASSNFYSAIATNLQLPTPFYAQYRLVSAGIKVKYVGAPLYASGRIDTAFDIQSGAVAPQASGTVIAEYAKYGNFSQAENAYFYKSSSAIATSMQPDTCIYLPHSPNLNEFYNLGVQPGVVSTLLLNVIGCQPSVIVAEVQLAATFEAIVENEYTDYIPCSIYKAKYGELESAAKIIGNAISLGELPTVEENTVSHDITKSELQQVNKTLQDSEILKTASPSLIYRWLDFVTDIVPGYKLIKDMYNGKDTQASVLDAIKNTASIVDLIQGQTGINSQQVINSLTEALKPVTQDKPAGRQIRIKTDVGLNRDPDTINSAAFLKSLNL